MAKVHEDKRREANAGFDGTWVAHPGLVSIAEEEFGEFLGERPNQKDRLREDVVPDASTLLDVAIPGSSVTEAGVRMNISVALQYLDAWLGGSGAAAINNLMEDVATAEISRAQLWQWMRHGAVLDTGETVNAGSYTRIRAEELASLGGESADYYGPAAQILDELVLSDGFPDFLTLVAYPRLQ